MKSKKRAFLFTLLFTMVCMVMQAQSLQVEGTVISKSDGEPIIGATILEKGPMVRLLISTVNLPCQLIKELKLPSLM